MPKIRHLASDRYYNYQELTELLQDLAAAYPHLAKLHAIGQSHRGRTIWLLEITNPDTGSADQKPGYYIDANTHAEEITGTTVVVHTAWTLLNGYGQDPPATRLLDEQVFYLVPRLNPDGAEIILTMPFYEWIGNGRYLPGEEQFGPGLHYADVNGDGFILDMRIRDDAGEWKASQKDDRVMLPRDPDETGGEYYRMVPEGMLVDWDGGDFVIPRPQDGNLNRNYPSNWEPEVKQYGAGEFPVSEPEAAAVVRWILDHPNIAGIQSYHTHSGVILRPWLTLPDSEFLGHDKAIYEALGEMGVKETGYPLISVFEDFTPDKKRRRYGSALEWTFGALGIISFSTELWDVFKAAGVERKDFFPLRPYNNEEDQIKLLQWQDEHLKGDGFMRWTPFQHPQLGPVEIGGWKRIFTFRNPPPGRYLEEEARANCQFTLRHAAAAPKLRLRDVAVAAEGEGVFHLQAVVDNVGFLPTNLSEQAVAMQMAPSVAAELTGPEGMRFVQGQAHTDLGHLAGRSGRTRAYTRFYDWPLGNCTVQWTVKVPAGRPAALHLTVGCPRAGRAQATVRIGADGRATVEPQEAAGGRIGA
ncbi:MAG: peptidase M14 [Chloroflexi bacterium]|nr:peptidase M14 [Chloroflexota bacterium]